MGASHPFGLFSWTDVTVHDIEAAKAFYVGLFDWEASDQHDPDGNHIYTSFAIDGKEAAGMSQMPAPLTEQGMAPFWNSYVTVANVDATIEAAEAAGGSLVMEPMDVFTAGRMAVLADPAGAVFSIWQATESRGGEVFNVHGAMTWNELASPDIPASRTFYGDVLGWEFEEMPGPSEYWVIVLDTKVDGDIDQDDKYNGGILPLSVMPEGVPSYWAVYFYVDDTDAILAKAVELGGSSVIPPMDTPAGRIGVIQDPQGGMFNVIQPPAPQ